jgi:hypothetical protein
MQLEFLSVDYDDKLLVGAGRWSSSSSKPMIVIILVVLLFYLIITCSLFITIS